MYVEIRFVLRRKFATGKPLESLVHKCFTEMCTLIDKENGQPFDPLPRLTLLMYNILASMTFGKTWVSSGSMYMEMLWNEDRNEWPSINLSHLVVGLKIKALLFNQDMCFSFEPDDPFFVFVSTAIDEFNENVGNGILADIYPILKVSNFILLDDLD